MPSKKSCSNSREHENVENPRKISSFTSNLQESSGRSSRLGFHTTFEFPRSGPHYIICRLVISNFSEVRIKNMFYSPLTSVSGLHFCLGMVANGPCGSPPGYFTFFILLDKDRCLKSDCAVGFKVTLVNHSDDSQSLRKVMLFRYDGKEFSYGWKDFAVLSTVLDPKSGFLSNQSILVTVHVCVLDDTLKFSVDGGAEESVSSSSDDVYVGKYTWKIRNFSLFKEMFETQMITSPAFKIGLYYYRLTMGKRLIDGVEHLSLYLKSDIEFTKANERQWIDARKTEPYRSCWGSFGIWVLNQKPWLGHMHRNWTARFSTRSYSECCGWPDYMKMSDFIGSRKGFLDDDGTVVFCVSFDVVEESFYSKHGPANPPLSAFNKYDEDIPTFYWEMQNFTRLKESDSGIRIESLVMQVQEHSFLLAVYPRGLYYKSSDPTLVLEYINSSSNSLDWSGLVHSVFGMMNHKASEKSSTKESLRRCCDTVVEYGFITLADLFGENCGGEDTAVLFVQIEILKETLTIEDLIEQREGPSQIELIGIRKRYTWKVENFLAFKEILAIQRVFSKFFKVAECQFRIGVFIHLGSVHIYLDSSLASDADDNFCVSFRIGLLNQESPTKSLWKEFALFTKTWNGHGFNSMKLSDILEPDSGYVIDNMIVFVCEILDYGPWIDVSEPEDLGCDEGKVPSLPASDKPLKSIHTELNVDRLPASVIP